MLNYRIAFKFSLIIILLLMFQAAGESGERDTSVNLSAALQKEAHFTTIKELVRDGRYESAIAEAKAVTGLDPHDERGHIRLRAIYTLLQRYAEALEENLTETVPVFFVNSLSDMKLLSERQLNAIGLGKLRAEDSNVSESPRSKTN